MTDNIRIRQALTKIAWAYVLLYLDFNLGVNGHSLNVLPNWAGYLLIFSAIALLGERLRDLLLLKPFCILLGAVSGVDWLSFLLTGAEFTGRFFLLSALITCVALYLHFQLLTDLAALADRRSGEGGRSPLSRRLRLCRNADAVFRVAFCYLMVLKFHCGLLFIWMGMFLDWAMRSLFFCVRFVRGRWMEQKVI